MRTLTATSVMSLSASVLLGLVGAATMYVGARQSLAGTLTAGQFFSFTLTLPFLVAPIMQIVSIGTQLTEALAGLERTQEIMRERPEDQDPNRSVALRDIAGTVEFDDVSFSYDPAPRSAASHYLPLRTRDGDRAGRFVRIRKVDDHRIDLGVLCAVEGHDPRGRRGLKHGPTGLLPHAAGSCAAGIVSVRRDDPRERRVLAARCQRGRTHARLPHRARR